MSANTVTDAASAVSATSTASLAATRTITAASIRAAASIAVDDSALESKTATTMLGQARKLTLRVSAVDL